MWFAIHLVRHEIISPEVFVDAVETVLKSRVPIGRLAAESHHISMRQVFEILSIQSTTGERFGRIAVRLGYLTEAQIAELLAVQANRDKSIGEVLVDLGAISRERMEAELARFRHQQISDGETPAPVAASAVLAVSAPPVPS